MGLHKFLNWTRKESDLCLNVITSILFIKGVCISLVALFNRISIKHTHFVFGKLGNRSLKTLYLISKLNNLRKSFSFYLKSIEHPFYLVLYWSSTCLFLCNFDWHNLTSEGKWGSLICLLKKFFKMLVWGTFAGLHKFLNLIK